MRENRPYGSEGGAARKGRSYPYPGASGVIGRSRSGAFFGLIVVFAGWKPAVVRPTARINSEVQVLAGGEASAPVSEPNCVAVRRGGEQGDEKRWPVGVRT